jgi:hypothetical protein
MKIESFGKYINIVCKSFILQNELSTFNAYSFLTFSIIFF